MSADDSNGKSDIVPSDVWDEFRNDDQEPIDISQFECLPLSEMPDDVRVWVLDDYFPDTYITRKEKELVCHIEDHIYTKFWEHKFSAYAFSKAMKQAIRRMSHEGHPFANPELDDDDIHIFVRWDLHLASDMPAKDVAQSVRDAFDIVYARASMILENSDSVLVLGKDTGASIDLLRLIAARLEELGYCSIIIKDQPDKLGEGVVQKVMRYALTCKFVVVENTEASGHLYEIPHVAKAAECVTAFLQQEGKGATWMFEDAYAKHPHWYKFEYNPNRIEQAVDDAIEWAEAFIRKFGHYQQKVLPWMTPTGTP